jgi:hypothetical protein
MGLASAMKKLLLLRLGVSPYFVKDYLQAAGKYPMKR